VQVVDRVAAEDERLPLADPAIGGERADAAAAGRDVVARGAHDDVGHTVAVDVSSSSNA